MMTASWSDPGQILPNLRSSRCTIVQSCDLKENSSHCTVECGNGAGLWLQVTRKRITMITVLMVMILVVVMVMVKYFSGVLVEPLPLTSVVKCFC